MTEIKINLGPGDTLIATADPAIPPTEPPPEPTPEPTPTPPPAPSKNVGYFPNAKAFTTKIPADAKTDPLTPAFISKYGSRAWYLERGSSGVPIAKADPGGKTYPVPTKDAFGEFTGNGGLKTIPAIAAGETAVPAGAGYTGYYDRHYVIQEKDRSVEFFQSQLGKDANDKWTDQVQYAKSIKAFPFDGPGTAPGNNVTAAGFSLLAGLLTQADVDAGVANHALVCSVVGIAPGSPRPPATASAATGSGVVVEGTRLQLDPSVDLSKLTLIERIIGQAAKDYGMYVRDNGGQCSIYANLGAPAPSIRLNLPFSKLRVLAP